MGTRLQRVANVLMPLVLLVATVLCANLWLYHGWAASGPPSPRPEWHRDWSIRFFWLMCGCLALFAFSVWRARRRRTRQAG